MIPAGYMYKKVVSRPEWLRADSVRDVYSLSACVSEYFADYIPYWKHNGYWLFNSPAVMEEIAGENHLDLTGKTLFYYEVFEEEYDEETKAWSSFQPEASFAIDVQRPEAVRLEGYDVVTFSAGSCPECSPLSCNGLAREMGVNAHCLFETFDEAKHALETGAFDNSEPGPFRIFAIYSVKGG